MKTFKEFLYVFNFKVLLIVFVSLLATYLCDYLELIGDMPTSLIGIAVVFPIVFSINSAFQRRDKALEHYGIINANLASIFFTYNSWSENKISKKEDSASIKTINGKLLKLIKNDLIKENADKIIKKEIYKCFYLIFNKNEELRNLGITPTEIQTMNLLLNNVIVSFENLSAISDYRTPRGLRAYSKIFLNIFPIFFSPYFAKLNQELDLLGYVVALLFAIVLVILSNIQDNIENPFDFKGLDDIDLDRDNRFKNII